MSRGRNQFLCPAFIPTGWILLQPLWKHSRAHQEWSEGKVCYKEGSEGNVSSSQSLLHFSPSGKQAQCSTGSCRLLPRVKLQAQAAPKQGQGRKSRWFLRTSAETFPEHKGLLSPLQLAIPMWKMILSFQEPHQPSSAIKKKITLSLKREEQSKWKYFWKYFCCWFGNVARGDGKGKEAGWGCEDRKNCDCSCTSGRTFVTPAHRWWSSRCHPVLCSLLGRQVWKQIEFGRKISVPVCSGCADPKEPFSELEWENVVLWWQKQHLARGNCRNTKSEQNSKFPLWKWVGPVQKILRTKSSS